MSCQRSGKMGIWSLMNFGKETVKKICEISYGYSTAAVRKINDVVRVKGLKKLGEYMADDEGRAKMVYFSAKFVKKATLYALEEAANILIPAVFSCVYKWKTFTKILSETVREIEIESRDNTTDSVTTEMLKLNSENRVEVNSFAYQTPEDVLRFFMMMKFMKTRYLDSLLVSDHRRRKV
ncbi:uncharacterized protein LOC129871055 [Solanum dulcamara]|uniref:uncharacterized protein LOC129871055 n=1 Tax=Solanum dulcamara TaxID=45834 RepID=UPI0024866F8C|nr:uncharacterized protein LOC129871055 [Solanum dulcamara]